MANNKKITDLDEISSITVADDDVLAIVDVSQDKTYKIRKDAFVAGISGVTSFATSSPLSVNSPTGSVVLTLGTVPVSKGGTGGITASEARSNIGLGSIATQNSDDISVTGGSISGMSSVGTTTLSATGTSTLSTVDINGGNIDGTAIGSSSASTGTFSTLTVNNDAIFNQDVHFDGATAGRDVTWDRSSNRMQWNDDAYATFGNSQDLSLQHTSSNSYINNKTGSLFIRNEVTTTAAGISLQVFDNADVFHNVVAGIGGVAAPYVALYYDGSSKLITTSGGVDVTGLAINGTAVTATAAELNKLDGVTASTTEINILDGLTSSTAELNKLDGYTGGVEALNYLQDLFNTGVTDTEFDKLDGVSGTIWHNGNDLLDTSSSGYVKLPNGLYIMWGSATFTTSGFRTVPFPITFPTAVLQVNVGMINTTVTSAFSPVYMTANSITTSGFDSSFLSTISQRTFIAIGY